MGDGLAYRDKIFMGGHRLLFFAFSLLLINLKDKNTTFDVLAREAALIETSPVVSFCVKPPLFQSYLLLASLKQIVLSSGLQVSTHDRMLP